MNFPKISIVTPSYNQGIYLEETILSVIKQEYPNLEYIIIDGGSTDNSVEIIKKYEKHLSYWVSEPDKGMYHAIQKGFEKTTGEIMSWINSDDLLSIKSLFTVAQIFTDYHQIEWLSGVSNQVDETGRSTWTEGIPQWNKFKYLLSDFKYIQQEGIFWRRSLWEMSGSCVSGRYKLAGDVELWSRFFQNTDLYFITGFLGTFRMRSQNQKSLEGLQLYNEEAQEILKNMPRNPNEQRILQILNTKIWTLLKDMPHLRRVFGHDKIEAIIRKFPPPLVFDRSQQKFKL